MTAPRNLQKAYEAHVRSGAARGRDGALPETLAPEIIAVCGRLSNTLRAGGHLFTQYRQLLISKGAGKPPRVISIPTARDRIVLRSLADLLTELFPRAKGTIPQQRVEEVRRSLASGSRTGYVRIDVKDFYPSVSHAEIRAQLAGRIRKPEITSVIMQAISTPTAADGMPKRDGLEHQGVPQGLAISNLLAEIIASSVDSQFDNDNRMEYFRFVDDVLLLCEEVDAPKLYAEVTAAFHRIGLTVHPCDGVSSRSSVGLISEGFDYLGYVFASDSVSVRKASIRRVESALARAFTRYAKAVHDASDPETLARALAKCAWDVNLIVTGCMYKGIARGWLQYFRQMDDLTLLKRLDATVQQFARRFKLPPLFAPKSFMRAYWTIRRPRSHSSAYIPNFDTFTIDQMREYLILIAGVTNVDSMADSVATAAFFRLVSREVADLEMDVGFVS